MNSIVYTHVNCVIYDIGISILYVKNMKGTAEHNVESTAKDGFVNYIVNTRGCKMSIQNNDIAIITTRNRSLYFEFKHVTVDYFILDVKNDHINVYV